MDPVTRAMGILFGSAGGDLLLNELPPGVRLDVLDEHMARLEGNFFSLQDQMLRLIAHSKRRRNALLAVSRLPAEVFAEIAAHVLHDLDPSFNYPQNILSMMLVCKQWHGIVDNTPSLWSHLRPSFPVTYTIAALFKSKSATLDVWQPQNSFPDSEDHDSYTTFMEMVLPEVPRWGAARISPPALLESAHRALSQHAPKLTSFAMDLRLWSSDDYPPEPFDLFGGYAPRLRDLELVAVPVLHSWPILRGLTSLSLTFPTHVRPSTIEVLDVLEQCPDLATLTLGDGNSVSEEPAAGYHVPKHVQLSKLLRLTLDYLDLDLVCILFGSISAPICFELTINSVFEEAFANYPVPTGEQLADSFPMIHRRLQAAQTVQILNPGETSSVITVQSGGGVCLTLDFADHGLFWTMEWLAEITPGLKRKEAKLDFETSDVGDRGVLAALDERLHVVELSTSSHEDQLENVERLLEYLGTPTIKSNVIHWPFPHLKTLMIYTDGVNPTSILKMMKSRCGVTTWSPVGTMARNLPRGLDELYVLNAVSDEESRDAITKLVGKEVVAWEDDES